VQGAGLALSQGRTRFPYHAGTMCVSVFSRVVFALGDHVIHREQHAFERTLRAKLAGPCLEHSSKEMAFVHMADPFYAQVL